MAALVDIIGKVVSGEWGTDDDDGTGIPVLRTTNFTNTGVVNYENVVTRTITKKNISDKFLQPGDIIIEKSGGSDNQPVGRVIYFDGPRDTYLFNNFTGLLRVIDTSKWYPKYVFYTLFANYQRGETRNYENRTTGLHNLQADSYIRSVEVRDCSYAEQIRFCDTLDLLSLLIGNCNQRLEKLNNLINSRFVEMFGDPIDNPMGWETKPLLSLGKCKNGMNFHYDEEGVTINCLGVGDFKNNSVISSTKELPTISLNEMPSDEYLLRDDDIVFVRSNGNKALVGRSVAVYPGETPTTFSGFCIRYRKEDSCITVPYLLRVLKSDSVRRKMAGRGANIQNLNQQILGTILVPVPPVETQNEFAIFVDQIDESKAVVQGIIEKLSTLQVSLMQEYFD